MLAATNLPEALDSALTRPGRFDRIVHVPNPDIGGRREILRHYLSEKPTTDDVDVESLARGTAGFSGAELYNLVNMAAVQAAVSEEASISGASNDTLGSSSAATSRTMTETSWLGKATSVVASHTHALTDNACITAARAM